MAGMSDRRKLKKSGKHIPPRGVRLSGKKKFEPVLPTDSGIKVRSQYEKKCADYLYRNGIRFQYEPLILPAGRQYRPDFYLPDYNVFVEICGYGHMPFYKDKIAHKEQLYKKHKLNALFVHYEGKGSLEKQLADKLTGCGV